LDHFRREIEQWRRRQSGRKRLPREFWAQAVALAQTHGVHPTARTLGLKYSSLKQHLNATVGAASQAPPNRCEFAELLPGAPLDNNLWERALKKAILHRRNAYFYKTDHGARTGDLFMSLIHTCELNWLIPRK
jgi:transposase-like protein